MLQSAPAGNLGGQKKKEISLVAMLVPDAVCSAMSMFIKPLLAVSTCNRTCHYRYWQGIQEEMRENVEHVPRALCTK